MSGRAFFDTNVLVYLLGEDDRSAVAESIVARGGVVSVQVLNELAAVARRKLGMSWGEIADALSAVRELCRSPVLPLTLEIHEAALRIAAEYGYHVYDALIAAAALASNCTVLFSEDLQDGQVIEGRLTIRNPFLQPQSA